MSHNCIWRGQVPVHRNHLQYLLLFYWVINSLINIFFLPEWSKLFSEKKEIFLLYTKINVGVIYFLSFSKRVMLCLEKSYFMFCNNQIPRCSVLLYSSFILSQNSTISLLSKGWHPPQCILTPPHLWVKLCNVFEQILNKLILKIGMKTLNNMYYIFM